MQYRSVYRLFYSVPVKHAGERFVQGGGRGLPGKISLENFPELGSVLINKPRDGSFAVQPVVRISRKHCRAQRTAPWKCAWLGELTARPALPARSRGASLDVAAGLVWST